MYNYISIGMLSKAKGQILRVAACLNVLFCDGEFDENNEMEVSPEIPLVITEKAIVAAQNMVDVACQHCIYIAGKSSISEELKRLSSG